MVNIHPLKKQLTWFTQSGNNYVELLESATDAFIGFHDISNLLVVKEKYSTIRNKPMENSSSVNDVNL